VAAFEAWFTEADRHSPERHMNHNVAQHVAWLRRFQSECDLRAAFVACGWRGVPGGSLGWILGNSASRGDLDL